MSLNYIIKLINMSKEDIKDQIEENYNSIKSFNLKLIDIISTIYNKNIDINNDNDNNNNNNNNDTHINESINNIESIIQENENLNKEIAIIKEHLTQINFMSDEDLEMFTEDIESLNKEIAVLKKELVNKDDNIKSLKSNINQLETNLKEDIELNLKKQKLIQNNENKLKLENESLKDKLNVISKNIEEEKSKLLLNINKYNSLESQYSELKLSNSQLNIKYNNLLDENEIANKNIKKNYGLEKQLKETKNKLSECESKINSINFEEIEELKLLNNKLLKQIESNNNLIKNILEPEIANLKSSLNKLKDENFIKFDRINKLENDIKVKNLKINELKDMHSNDTKDIQLLIKEKEEIEIKLKTNSNHWEKKTYQLKQEIEKLIISNEKLNKENIDLKKSIDNSEYIGNFAKLNKDNLTKKDFSMLETMSRRVEEVEQVSLNLRDQVSFLSLKNDKMQKLLGCYMNKDFNEIYNNLKNNNFDNNYSNSNNEYLYDEDIEDIRNFKCNVFFNTSNGHQNCDVNKIFDYITVLKQDNNCLKKQISDITIECNKVIREYSIK